VNKDPLVWFTDHDCKVLHLKNYRHERDRKPAVDKKIEDPDIINKLIHDIEQIPTNGDLMIKFGPDVSHLTLVFQCGGGAQIIHFYDERLKTPSTGFNTGGDALEKEKHLWNYIRSLLK
jgi:hypothetical protein